MDSRTQKSFTLAISLLLLISLSCTPFLTCTETSAAEADDIRLIREFGEEESVHDAIRYHGEVYFFTLRAPIVGEPSLTLWKTDGTTQGTVVVKRLAGQWAEQFVTHRNSPTLPRERRGDPILINDNFYFFTRDLATGTDYLWQSGGTEAGTRPVTPLPEHCSHSRWDDAHEMNGVLYFLDASCLWRTDGTGAGTWQVSSAFDWAEPPVIYQNRLYFSAADDPHDQELWISDGTPAGTRLFADLNVIEDSLCLPDDASAGANTARRPGCSSSSFPENYAISGNELYFTAFSPLIGVALWKTNGNGVRLVKDFHPGNAYDTNPSPLPLPNGKLLIWADDGQHGWELWTSDGTTAGTTLLRDIFPGPGDGVCCGSNLGVLNNFLFFPGNDGVHGQSLWKTDGTGAGTVPVKHFSGANPYNHSVTHSPFDNEVLDGRLYFDVSGQFWATDGTGTGTTMLAANINSYYVSGDQPDTNSAIFNNRLILSAGDDLDPDLKDFELWATDGTKAGTRLIKDILPGVYEGMEISSSPEFFFPMEQSLLFFAGSSIYYQDNRYLRTRTGLFSLTTRPVTLPWLKPLLLSDP